MMDGLDSEHLCGTGWDRVYGAIFVFLVFFFFEYQMAWESSEELRVVEMKGRQ